MHSFEGRVCVQGVPSLHSEAVIAIWHCMLVRLATHMRLMVLLWCLLLVRVASLLGL